jgi:hypothetical protein
VKVIRKPLTPNRTLKNQLQSPLLRLPPELRNKIYDYVCGGLTVCPTKMNTPPYRLWSRYTKDRLTSDWKPLPNPTSYLLVCRQMYSEMALLPLKLNDFEIFHFRSSSQFIGQLSTEQRNAIDSVSFTLDPMTTNEILRQQSKAHIHAAESKKALGAFDHSIMLPLKKLAGLRRMVVEVEDMGQEEWCFEYQRGFVRGLAKQWGGPDGLEIVFRQWLRNLG